MNCCNEFRLGVSRECGDRGNAIGANALQMLLLRTQSLTRHGWCSDNSSVVEESGEQSRTTQRLHSTSQSPCHFSLRGQFVNGVLRGAFAHRFGSLNILPASEFVQKRLPVQPRSCVLLRTFAVGDELVQDELG